MRGFIKALLTTALIGLISGCNIVSAVAYKVSGAPKEPAEYKPENRLTLVLVEHYENPDQYHGSAVQLERQISNELAENKAVPLVPGEKLEVLRSNDVAAYRKLSIDQVGKALGAKQVIYVNLVKFTADTPIGGSELAGLAEARVRIIDVDTGRKLWPADSSEGREIKYETKHEEAVNFESRPEVQDQLSQSLAGKIARLFYAAPEAEADVAPKS